VPMIKVINVLLYLFLAPSLWLVSSLMKVILLRIVGQSESLNVYLLLK